MDCGPTCLRMVAKHYGRSLSAQELREAAEIGKDGVNMLGIAQAAENRNNFEVSVHLLSSAT
jgi:ATP-binding cassette, subfamily B, bacterial